MKFKGISPLILTWIRSIQQVFETLLHLWTDSQLQLSSALRWKPTYVSLPTKPRGQWIYSAFKTLHASRRQFGQFVPIRLRAHTTTSTTWPSPLDFSSSRASDPGRGILLQVSASTTNFPSDIKSKDKTIIPSRTRERANAASPHPKSAMTVFVGYSLKTDI